MVRIKIAPAPTQYNIHNKKLTNINTSTTSTPTPTPFNRQSSYVPPSPFVTSYKPNEDDDMGFDYYKPANAPITNILHEHG